MNTQAKIALDKQKHPERYCAEPRCLWKVLMLVYDANYNGTRVLKPDCPGGRCPKHQKVSKTSIADECICNTPESWGYTCPVHKTKCRAEVKQ